MIYYTMKLDAWNIRGQDNPMKQLSCAGVLYSLELRDLMSFADDVFVENCKNIIQNGTWTHDHDVRARWEDGTPAHTIKLFGVVNRYDLSREFPIMTLRKTAFKSCIDEILWIWQKKSNKVSDLNSHIWDSWVDEQGTIGKAYGYQLGVKNRYAEGEFDQVDRILYDLKHNPQSRRILANIYNHADLMEMNLYPCAYSLLLNVSGTRLNAILNQRSQDFLVANNWNVCQYAVLLHLFAQASGLVAGELIHVIGDAHIYDRHLPIIESIIERKPFSAPGFQMNRAKSDFYAFEVDDFELDSYQSHELNIKIPVAI